MATTTTDTNFGELDDVAILADINKTGFYSRKLPADYPWSSTSPGNLITPITASSFNLDTTFEAIPSIWSPAAAVTDPQNNKDFLYELIVEGYGQLVIRKELIPLAAWFIRDMSQLPRAPLVQQYEVKVITGKTSKVTKIAAQYGPNIWALASNVIYTSTDLHADDNPVFKSRVQSVAPNYASFILRPYVYAYNDGIEQPDSSLVANLCKIYGFTYEYLFGNYWEDFPLDPYISGYAYYDMNTYSYDTEEPWGQYVTDSAQTITPNVPAAVYSDDGSNGPTIYGHDTAESPNDPAYIEPTGVTTRDWFKFKETKTVWETLIKNLADNTRQGYTTDLFTPKFGVT